MLSTRSSSAWSNRDKQDADLTPFLGQRSRITKILNRNRGLSLAMVRELHKGLRIPLDWLKNQLIK